MNKKILPLSQGKFAIVDAADFEKVGHFKWHISEKSSGNFYAARNIGKWPNQTTIYLHCEIMGIKGVDHKNGDGLDCRRENLRPATQQQNGRASRRKVVGCSSQFRGVCWNKRAQKWMAVIRAGGKLFYLGLFFVETDAARAYDKAAKKFDFFKEALNFPLDSVRH